MSDGVMKLEQGDGRVTCDAGGTYSLTVAGKQPGYSNAQLYDYGKAAGMRWSPPLTLTLEARFSGTDPAEWDGTAGFGFWNAPFGGQGRLPRLPTALWFFLAGPSNRMEFAAGVPGSGWKAATIHAHTWRGYALAPCGPVAALLMRRRRIYQRLWPLVQAQLGIAETRLPFPRTSEWQRYRIEWGRDKIRFRVANGGAVADFPVPIGGKLGLVIWVDNQYMVATPQGRFTWGTRTLRGEQRLDIRQLQVEEGISHSQ